MEKKKSFFSSTTVKTIKQRVVVVIMSFVVLAVLANVRMTFDLKHNLNSTKVNTNKIRKLEEELDRKYNGVISKIGLIEKHASQLKSQWVRINDVEKEIYKISCKNEGESGKFHEGMENLKLRITDLKIDVRELRAKHMEVIKNDL